MVPAPPPSPPAAWPAPLWTWPPWACPSSSTPPCSTTPTARATATLTQCPAVSSYHKWHRLDRYVRGSNYLTFSKIILLPEAPPVRPGLSPLPLLLPHLPGPPLHDLHGRHGQGWVTCVKTGTVYGYDGHTVWMWIVTMSVDKWYMIINTGFDKLFRIYIDNYTIDSVLFLVWMFFIGLF